jgi:hypothetical protein
LLISLEEAKQLLRIDGTDYDQILNQILPAVDQYLLDATGKDFSGDAVAKMAAGMLVMLWFENPSMIGKVEEMTYGLTNLIKQLQAKALPDESTVVV